MKRVVPIQRHPPNFKKLYPCMEEEVKYLQVKDWQEWQSYRTDRGTPPWIKVHRCVLSNPKWAILSDSEKGQLLSIWIVAADNGGQIPDDNNILRKICQLDTPPNLNKFKEIGFFENEGLPTGNQVVTTPPQLDPPETEAEVYRGEVYSKEIEVSDSIESTPSPEEAINIWNDKVQSGLTLNGGKVILNTGRKGKIKSRLREYCNNRLEDWEAYCDQIANTPFLMGDNNRQWKISIDWALEPKNITKIIENNYERSTKQTSNNRQPTADDNITAGLLQFLAEDNEPQVY